MACEIGHSSHSCQKALKKKGHTCRLTDIGQDAQCLDATTPSFILPIGGTRRCCQTVDLTRVRLSQILTLVLNSVP